MGGNTVQTILTENKKKVRRNTVKHPVKTIFHVELEVGLGTNPAAVFRAKIRIMLVCWGRF